MEEEYQTGEGASAQGYEPKKKRKKERSTKKRAPARNMHVFSPGCWKQTGSSKQVRRAHGGGPAGRLTYRLSWSLASSDMKAS